SFSLGFWIDTGSKNENKTTNGLSHFVEHMLFKGTKKYSAYNIVKEIEIRGGILNAFTTKELICIHVEILDEAFEKAYDIMSDMLLNSEFAAKEIEKEKEVIFEEINGVHDVPEEFIEDKFSELLFKNTVLSQPILGEIDTVTAITKNDLKQEMAVILKNRGITVTAAGNIKHEVLAELIKRDFNFERFTIKPQEKIEFTPTTDKVHFKKILTQSHITIGMPVCGYSSKERYYVYLLHFLLGAGMSSLLFQVLREEKGLAYHLYSYYEFYKDTGMFNIYLCTDNSKKNKVLPVIEKEFKNLQSNGISQIMLNELKSQLKGQMALKLEKIPNRMLNLGRQIIYSGKVTPLDDILNSIDKITLE
ncbi:MAG: insulinase family protein, partial [Calditrichia bacterium]|nr:insulinase family protein [Calditrichia bacterium]